MTASEKTKKKVAAPPPSAVTTAEVTPASQWRRGREEGFRLELPSGNVARVRRTIDMLNMIKTGQIPNPLAGEIRKMINERSSNLDVSRLDDKMMQQMLQLVDETCAQVFIEPRVELPPEGANVNTWQPDDPEAISVADLAPADRFFVWQFVQGGPADLAPFRQEPDAPVDAVPDVEAVREQPEPAPVG